MRTFGIAVAALLGGLVGGMIVIEIVGRIVVADNGDLTGSSPLALLIGSALPGLALLGALLAPFVDSPLRRRHSPSPAQPADGRDGEEVGRP